MQSKISLWKKNHEKKTSEFYRQFIKILREKVFVLLYVTYNKNSEEQFIKIRRLLSKAIEISQGIERMNLSNNDTFPKK